jgi:hypothetical protein
MLLLFYIIFFFKQDSILYFYWPKNVGKLCHSYMITLRLNEKIKYFYFSNSNKNQVFRLAIIKEYIVVDFFFVFNIYHIYALN